MTDPHISTVPEALLVAMDFSAGSRRALELSLALCPRGEITALHVVDTEFAARVEAEGVATSADVVTKLRTRATEEFGWLVQEKGPDTFNTMTVEGIPFVEIIKIAKDLDVDMIVMGMHKANFRVDEILFGSTAEKVLRTSHCPVLCVP
ncbi:MAG TPA: universal stress protein [Candidatus Binatia bacterium]|jgi:nucleotide-binding universal stress UspA family protein